MEKGLNGVKLAMKVCNEYYAKTDKAHSSSDEETELMATIKSFEEIDTSNTSLEELLRMRNAESEASKQTLKDDQTLSQIVLAPAAAPTTGCGLAGLIERRPAMRNASR